MSEPFHSHRRAVLAVLTTSELSPKQGGFLGQMAFSDEMTPKQRRWLDILLDRHGLPPLTEPEPS